MHRSIAGGAGKKSTPTKYFVPAGKMCLTEFKTIGHSVKYLSPSQNTLRPAWCSKLVTALEMYDVKI